LLSDITIIDFGRNSKKRKKLKHYKKLLTNLIYWRIYRYSVYKSTDYHRIVKIKGEIEDELI